MFHFHKIFLCHYTRHGNCPPISGKSMNLLLYGSTLPNGNRFPYCKTPPWYWSWVTPKLELSRLNVIIPPHGKWGQTSGSHRKITLIPHFIQHSGIFSLYPHPLHQNISVLNHLREHHRFKPFQYLICPSNFTHKMIMTSITYEHFTRISIPSLPVLYFFYETTQFRKKPIILLVLLKQSKNQQISTGFVSYLRKACIYGKKNPIVVMGNNKAAVPCCVLEILSRFVHYSVLFAHDWLCRVTEIREVHCKNTRFLQNITYA